MEGKRGRVCRAKERGDPIHPTKCHRSSSEGQAFPLGIRLYKIHTPWNNTSSPITSKLVTRSAPFTNPHWLPIIKFCFSSNFPR